MSRMREEPREQARPEDAFIEWISWLMDGSIHIGPWSIGLDGLLGLIPGVGDMAGAAVSVLMIGVAMQTGIAKSAVMRMVINVAIDSLLGSIPLIGDLFDFAFKSNLRNAQIYREAIRGERVASRDWGFIILVFLILLVVVSLPILGFIVLAKLLAPYMPATF